MDAHYEEGNRFYKEGKIEKAYDQYSLGLDMSSSPYPSDSATITASTYFKLLSNRSICAIQLRNYEQALKDIDFCLRLDEDNTKALMRRCKVFEYKGDFTKALNDCKAVLSTAEQTNCVSLFSNMMQTCRRLEQCIERDVHVRKAEGVPAKFVTEAQALRLTFLEQLPRRVKTGVTYHVKVSVSNEFGLWQRQLLYADNERNSPSGSPENTYIHCTANCIDGLSDLHDFHCDQASIGEDGKAELYFHFDVNAINLHKVSPTSASVYILNFSCDAMPNGCEVCEVSTLPTLVLVDISDDQNESMPVEFMNVGESIGAACIRNINFNDNCVYALESPGYLGIGGKVWDSTYVLLNYLERPSNKNLIQGKRVIELGSGTGIAGIALTSLNPSSLMLTDLSEVVPLIKENLRLNRILAGRQDEGQRLTECIVEACEYPWGSCTFPCVDGKTPKFDTIVASDVIYDPHGYRPLYDTLCCLLGVSDDDRDRNESIVPMLILAHRHRHPEDHKFFDMLYSNESLVIEKIEWKDAITSHALLSPDIILFRVYCKL